MRLKNFGAALMLLLAVTVARAAELDLSLGNSHFTRPNNTIWWQDGFPSSFKLSTTFYSLGLRGDNWRVGYASLGRAAMTSLATDRDEDYNVVTHSCNHGCEMAGLVGSSKSDGIYATHLFKSNSGLFLEGGAWLYRTFLSMQASVVGSGVTYTFPMPAKYGLGPVLGIGYEKGNWGVAATVYYERRWGPYPAIYSPWAGVLAVRYSF